MLKNLKLKTYEHMLALGFLSGADAATAKNEAEKDEASFLKTLFTVATRIKEVTGWHIDIETVPAINNLVRTVVAVVDNARGARFNAHVETVDNIAEAMAYMVDLLHERMVKEPAEEYFIMDGSTM